MSPHLGHEVVLWNEGAHARCKAVCSYGAHAGNGRGVLEEVLVGSRELRLLQVRVRVPHIAGVPEEDVPVKPGGWNLRLLVCWRLPIVHGVRHADVGACRPWSVLKIFSITVLVEVVDQHASAVTHRLSV
eukprot:CAMPEP_0181447602 /NCGR_PEP_ID=MMETSP1110-20121109/26706_1 /TAXON_ID=174948 /ORGANISM="Symbiodinium sp., Strain CCMP421" /LENGTH=129 /DNA_ID=CAMNT_0023571719 /DNA_START=393 /DNA_END=782 /DNA_ORIENTATION=+